ELRGASPMLAIQARGTLHVGQFAWKKLVATEIVTQMNVDRGEITLTALRGQLLQGSHQGNWTIDVSNRDASTQGTSSPPLRYHGSGTLHDISLVQVGVLMNDDWIAGTADGKFELEGSGDSFRDLLARSDGKLQFVMRNGSLPHIEIPGSSPPLLVHRFAGELHLKKGTWELPAGRLESHDGIYQVRGKASSASGFDFLLTRGDEKSWSLTGTLAHPRVTPVNRTEAKRADADAKTDKP